MANADYHPFDESEAFKNVSIKHTVWCERVSYLLSESELDLGGFAVHQVQNTSLEGIFGETAKAITRNREVIFYIT